MLTGKRAFPGDDVADTLAAIVRGEPEWALLRMFRRESRKRCSCVGKKIGATESTISVMSGSRSPAVRSRDAGHEYLYNHGCVLPHRCGHVGGAAALIVAIVIGGHRLDTASGIDPACGRRYTLPIAQATRCPTRTGRGSASRCRRTSGRWSHRGAQRRRELFRRQVGELVTMSIPGTETGLQPFFSPDGQWIGYFNGK